MGVETNADDEVFEALGLDGQVRPEDSATSFTRFSSRSLPTIDTRKTDAT